MLLCTCLYHLWEPFSVLDFIGSEFCFIWLCNEVFVKWSVLWSKVLLQFHVSDHGLVTVAWDSSKICLFCSVGIEADLYDLCVSLCDVIIVLIDKYLILCFLWCSCHEHCMYRQHDRDCSMEWRFMCGVTSFANVWKHNKCCNDIHTRISPEDFSMI